MFNKNVLLVLAAVFLGIALAGCTDTFKTKGYKVYSTKETENSITNVVFLRRVISKDSTIEIARQLYRQADTKKYFSCNFYQPGMELSIAWATVDYLTDSTKCNAKDKNGACVKYDMVMPHFIPYDELKGFKSARHDHKYLIKEVVDIYAMVKYEVYRVDGKPDEAVLVTLHAVNYETDTKLKVKQDKGITKYIYDAPKLRGGFILEKEDMLILDKEDSESGRKLYYF